MAAISTNKFPGIIIRESANDGSDFSNPVADYRVLFLGEDGLLHLRDSSGTVTDLGGSGAVATDAIWDAAGDIVQGTGSNTAARLPLGTALQQLRVNAGATALEYFTPSGGAFSGARVHNSGNLSINSSSATVLTFDTERFDTAAYHDTGSNTGRLTAPATAKYSIGATLEWAANSTGYRQVGLRVNGTTYIAFDGTLALASPQETRQTISTVYALSSTDYVEVVVTQTSGGALNVVAGGNYSPEFWIVSLGA